jgi:hypothetical protein
MIIDKYCNLDIPTVYDELSNEEMTQEMTNLIEYDNIKLNLTNNSLFNTFFTLEKKQKGRKRESNSKRKIHSKVDSDNMRNRLKISLFNFIIDFFNSLLKKLFSKTIGFKLINYKDKNIKSSKKLGNQLKMTMSEILSLDIQNNYKSLKKDHNRQILRNILNEINKLDNSTEYKQLFNMTLLNFYKKIYLSKNRIELEKKYGLPKDIELFYDFFAKLNEDVDYKKKFELIALNLPKFAKLEYNFKHTKFKRKNVHNQKELNTIFVNNKNENENVFDTPFELFNNENNDEPSIYNDEFQYLGNKRF